MGRVAALALAASLLVAGIVSARSEPVKIRAGWVSAPASLIPVLFAKPGIARHHGQSYLLQAVYFPSSPLQITALAAGELEIALLGYSSVSFAILNAGLRDLRVIADEIRDGAEDHFSVAYMVRKDSPIRAVADLKGKVVATNGLGSGVYMGMRAMLQKSGLDERRDYTVIETPFPNMKAILLDRKADLVTVTVPFAFDPERQAQARTLFTQRDAMGPVELSFWSVRAGLIAKSRAAMVDLLEDYLRAVRWYRDPAHRAEAISIIA